MSGAKALSLDDAIGLALNALVHGSDAASSTDAPRRDRPAGLTSRETEVLRFIARGKSNKEIASDLVLSRRTVERHITNLYAKIGARGKADATAYALRHNVP
jgi:DNA-binding NarL/FixJ family response regulator